MPRARSLSPPAPRASPLAPLATRMRYQIGRGEQGVLSFEPYKSYLLPLWRFRTPGIAEESSRRLESEFARFVDEGDFVGADMVRKFLQGMTRSQRYANRAGGRKYSPSGTVLPKSSDHAGAADKLASAGIFRAAWERAKARGEYQALRRKWEKEKEVWVKENPEEAREVEREREESKARKGGGDAKRAREGVKKEEERGVEEEEEEGARKAPANKRRRVQRESRSDEEEVKGESE
ncbi:hypothetical protein JCM10450v2_007824 [Rhodotorula kratochvilovae]